MPTKKACYCPTCKGELRHPATVKKHSARYIAPPQASISTAPVPSSSSSYYGGAVQSELEDEDDDDDEMLRRSDEDNSDMEIRLERPSKRSRIDNRGNGNPYVETSTDHSAERDPLPGGNHELFDHNQLEHELEPPPKEIEISDEPITSQQLRVGQINIGPGSESEESSSSEDDSIHDIESGTAALNLDTDEDAPQAIPSHIEHVKTSQAFIEAIKNATLENGKLDASIVERLRDPDTEIPDLSDFRFSLDLFRSCANASEETYNEVRKSVIREFPKANVLSYHLAKKMVAEVSGVVAVHDDMCINSCHAFTGPFADLEACSVCSEPRYTSGQGSRKKVAHQKFTTFPIGPQIQALRRSVEGANAMGYLDRKMENIKADFDALGDKLDSVFDDILCGSDVQNLIERLNVTSDDTLLIFSFDGAQLYQNKQSDTWIGIWIVVNYDPVTRYRKKHVLPAFIVPGPQKPKNLDSYLFRSFHHLSALQKENNGAGICVFNAAKNEVVNSRTIIITGTADAVGLTDLDGRVGHHGVHGCRKGCPMKGRHKPNSGHYFASHLKPNDYDVPDCNHEDFNFKDIQFQISPENYQKQLDTVVNSSDQKDYEKNRKLTGISKPSILLGLNPSYMLQVPLCFTVDLMHLFGLNATELLISLWRGLLKCESTDDKASWDWATFTGETWQAHGKLVASATKYFPSFFHRPPRNPAEKISSGYKASEFYLYVFGLGPGFFRALLPKKYWKNFCKFVRGVRIVMQRRITAKQAIEAHKYFLQFVEEFENIYYQRRADRLHFNRPCLHTALHTSAEIFRLGNGCHTAQYTMERAIGDLGKGIRQPSNPFGNLAQLALRQAQINATISIYPQLDKDHVKQLPQYSFKRPSGYTLLRPREKIARKFSDIELAAIQEVSEKDISQKWGRLLLPDGQIARSRYSEDRRNSAQTRISRNVKINLNGNTEFGEVQFYFLDRDNNESGVAYALLSVYGPPNQEMLDESSDTLHACEYTGQENLRCIPVTDIVSVVSMQPLPNLPGDPENLWFVVEKSGLDDIELTGFEGDKV